jgi:hypothetical protein
MRTKHKTTGRNDGEKIVYEPINNPMADEPTMTVLFLAEIVKSWMSGHSAAELPVIV